MKKRIGIKMGVIILLLIIGIVALCIYFSGDKNNNHNPTEDNYQKVEIQDTFNGKVSQSFSFGEEVSRNIPTSISNEGKNSRYPTYGTSLNSITDEEKDNLIAEANLIRASDSTFDSMDCEGNLYLNGEQTGKKLYKHTASVGMYYGDVSDDEPAVTKTITVQANEVRNYITGLYAPAGEVVKIEISEEDLAKIGGELTIVIGQTSHRNNVNNIWKARNDFSRMPTIASLMTVKTTTAYVGYALGGPIYIYPKTFGNRFSVTISGAVNYPYYIHGITTKLELEEMKNYSAPYFDFEVWDLGVRHSGPKSYAGDLYLDYDNLTKVGDLWEKICRTSRQVPCSGNVTIGVGFIYDSFVAAGEAVTFQGGHSWINAPCYWFSNALNYQSMTSTGFWGTIHEFNHLYQSYGMYGTKTNEVTNNATSLISYALYTNISSMRSENDSTLSGWNRYTDPSRSLRETIANETKGEAQMALNCYADILHSFGVDIYTLATRLQTQFGVDYWYEALSKATNYNMTYYFEQMLHQTISDDMKALYDDSSKITFVPVASLYQVGRSIYVNNKEEFIETVKPFQIEKGEDYILDFSKYLYVPKDFNFTITQITNPKSGKIEKIENNKYKYIPGEDEYSGEFKVTVKLENENIQTKDVTLVINLRQRISNLLNVTRYAYSSRVYNTVGDAISNNFAGYSQVTNSKTNSTFLNGIANNHIGIVEGKIYIPEDGEYVFCLRSGRGNNTLYLSLNSKDSFEQVLSLNSDHGGFSLDGEHTIKMTLKAGDYLYFKEITLSKHYANDAFTELGWANISKENPKVVTIPSTYLYNNNVEKTAYTFTSPEKYKRVYNESITLDSADITKQTIENVNFSSWDNTTKIENILDGNPNTFYHNNRNNFVSESNPFILEVNLNQTLTCNKIVITSRTSGQYNLPSSFMLYGGTDKDNLELLGTYTNLSLNGNKVEATFDEKTISYYKLYVTDTKSQNGGNKYVTISQIDFYYIFEGELNAPNVLTYYKSNTTSAYKQITFSTYGYVVKSTGISEYRFKGIGFVLFAMQDSDCKVEINIDGVTKTIDLNNSGQRDCIYSITGLQNTGHIVSIKVISGTLCVDSIITKS
mgnify:CR=1 FL=1